MVSLILWTSVCIDLPACLSACLSVCLSACLSVCLCFCLCVCVCVYLSVCLSTCVRVFLSACLCVCPSVCLPLCLSVSVYVSACLPKMTYITRVIAHKFVIHLQFYSQLSLDAINTSCMRHFIHTCYLLSPDNGILPWGLVMMPECTNPSTVNGKCCFTACRAPISRINGLGELRRRWSEAKNGFKPIAIILCVWNCSAMVRSVCDDTNIV